MQYKGYLARVEFDEDAGVLTGEVLGIRDVVTFQTDSAKEIGKAFRESVDDYLAFCAERGEEPNQPFSGKFLVRIDESLHRTLASIAAARNCSLNSVVEEFLTREAAGFVKPVESEGRNDKRKGRRHKALTAR